jgi:hypothetical protein
MSSAAVPKFEVACELLDRAIELHLRGDSYYAAIHLGAAAEEILSVCAREVSANGGTFLQPDFDQMKEAIVALSNPGSTQEAKESRKGAHDGMSEAKNTVKHKRGLKDQTVNFDAKEESYDIIDRAITTYFQLWSVLRLPFLAFIQEFDQRRPAERHE